MLNPCIFLSSASERAASYVLLAIETLILNQEKSLKLLKNFLYKGIIHRVIKRREEARRSFFQRTEQITQKKSDKQNISEILAFPLQLALHERLVSACLLKLWHDPSTLSPSETLTELWEYSDAALGVTCKTTAEDESFCWYKLHHCSSSTKKRILPDNHFKHQVSESRHLVLEAQGPYASTWDIPVSVEQWF